MNPSRWIHAVAAFALVLVLGACRPQGEVQGVVNEEVPPPPVVVAPEEPAPMEDVPPIVPVSLGDTEELRVFDEIAGREYPVWISFPVSYAKEPERRYPVLYITDALYSFPLVRSIRNMVGQGGTNIEDFILVGLPPQIGLSSKQSRSRDYTPTSPKQLGSEVYSAEEYGGAAHYRDFIEASVFPLVESRYRVDATRRAFAGHSYGGLFGSFVLVSKPDMFQTYLLSSPSLWFDRHAMNQFEAEYASAHRELKARVFLSIGQYETQGPTPRHFRNVDMVGDNARFAAKLKSRGYPGLQVETAVLDGEDHFTIYPAFITRALLKVFPGKGPYVSG